MKLSVISETDDLVLLRLEGRVSQRDVAPNEEPLGDLLGEDAYSKKLLMDLGDIVTLDSSGVNWMLVCHKRSREAGGQLVLHTLSPIARNVIRVLNLQTVFQLAEDLKAAKQMVEGES
jgi:anti-anti-sigma factor